VVDRGLSALLRERDFFAVWMAGALGGVVRWLEMLAFAVFVYDVSQSPFLVALVTLLRMLPLALFGALAGVIAERVDRRLIALFGLLSMMAVSLALGLLALGGEVRVWQLCLAAFVNGLYWCTDMPARRTLLSVIAGHGRTAAAMALDSATNSITRAVGPATGGLLLAATGLHGALFLGAGLYALAAAMLLLVRGRHGGAGAPAVGLWRTLKEGLAFAAGDRAIVGILVVTVIFNVWGFPYTSMIAVIGRESLLLGPFGVGLLMSAEGAGAFLAAVAVAVMARPPAYNRIYLYGALTTQIGMILLAASSQPVLSGLLVLLAGLGAGCFATMQSTLILLAAPPEARSRLMGVLVVCIGVGPLGFAHVGLMADWLGAVPAVAIMGLEGLLAYAVAWYFWPEIR
jgi:hypothetical protein